MNVIKLHRTRRTDNSIYITYIYYCFRTACEDNRPVTIELGSNQRIPTWFEIFIDNIRRGKRNARGRNVEEVDLSSSSFLTLESGEELHIFNPRFRVFDVHFESLSYQLETTDNSSFFSSSHRNKEFCRGREPSCLCSNLTSITL